MIPPPQGEEGGKSEGPITQKSHPIDDEYIIVTTDHITKWVEAKATRDNTIARFLYYENIITRFGCPTELVRDWGTHFVNGVIEAMLSRYQIFHRKYCAYYPRANGRLILKL